MMGRQDRDQGQLFYEFNLDDVIARDHLLRRMNGFVAAALDDLHPQLRPFYCDIGRPSVDPELLIRMLIVGYCSGIRAVAGVTKPSRVQPAQFKFAQLKRSNTPSPRHEPNSRPARCR